MTTAVREKLPAEGGVQATVYGAATTSAPICDCAPPEGVTKNATLLTVAPGLAVGLAVTVTGDPTVAELLFAGVVRETVGAATTVAEIALEVTDAPVESKTRAVSDTLPVVVGVHEIE